MLRSSQHMTRLQFVVALGQGADAGWPVHRHVWGNSGGIVSSLLTADPIESTIYGPFSEAGATRQTTSPATPEGELPGSTKIRYTQSLRVCVYQYMPPIPPMPPPPGIGGPAFSSSGFSTTTASVVSSSPAIEAAFWSAMRTTLVGSITPASTRFS